MSELFQFTVAVFGGTFFGSFLGPILLEEWKLWQKKRRWQKPREKIIQLIFSQPGFTFVSLDDIARAIGSTHEDTRAILISMDALGGTLQNGQEGWILDRTKASFHLNDPQ